ncbi:hypothetical protein [Achromobacter aegrifaciens]
MNQLNLAVISSRNELILSDFELIPNPSVRGNRLPRFRHSRVNAKTSTSPSTEMIVAFRGGLIRGAAGPIRHHSVPTAVAVVEHVVCGQAGRYARIAPTVRQAFSELAENRSLTPLLNVCPIPHALPKGEDFYLTSRSSRLIHSELMVAF